MARRTLFALVACFALAAPTVAAESDSGTIVYDAPIRVCADPNNLPYSNKAGEGFENKLARMLADYLGTSVDYTWFPRRRGFLTNTLEAGACDIVMGTPDVEGIRTTRRYYHSGYVFVSRKADGLTFSSMKSPELRHLRIGVPLVGEGGSPPAVALAQMGIIDNVVGYPVTGDYGKPSPPGDIVKAVATGEIDIAAVWGPIGGYFARQSAVPLRVTPITDTTSFLPQSFEYSISMGVRAEARDLEQRLNAFIIEDRNKIDALLASYGVPLL